MQMHKAKGAQEDSRLEESAQAGFGISRDMRKAWFGNKKYLPQFDPASESYILFGPVGQVSFLTTSFRGFFDVAVKRTVKNHHIFQLGDLMAGASQEEHKPGTAARAQRCAALCEPKNQHKKDSIYEMLYHLSGHHGDRQGGSALECREVIWGGSYPYDNIRTLVNLKPNCAFGDSK